MALVEYQPATYNIIRRILELPCAVEGTVYVELAIEAAISMIYGYVEPDLRELVTDITGKSTLCHIKGGIKEAGILKPEEESPTTKAVFKGAELFDRGTYWNFLAGLVEGGLAKFSSMLRHQAACNVLDKPNIGSGLFWFGAISDDGSWSGIDYQSQPGSKFGVWPSAFFALHPGASCTLACSAGFVDFNGTPLGTFSRIVDTTLNQTRDFDANSLAITDVTRMNHVFDRVNLNQFSGSLYGAQWSYFGPSTPLHECFAQHSSFGYVYRSDI